jgi:hypothetical protein
MVEGQARRPVFNARVNRNIEGKKVEREWAESSGETRPFVLRPKGYGFCRRAKRLQVKDKQ